MKFGANLGGSSTVTTIVDVAPAEYEIKNAALKKQLSDAAANSYDAMKEATQKSDKEVAKLKSELAKEKDEIANEKKHSIKLAKELKDLKEATQDR